MKGTFAAALLAALALPGRRRRRADVQAVDGVLPDGSDNRWTPNAVTVKVGEPVTWRFAGTTVAHNLRVDERQLDHRTESPIGRRRRRRDAHASRRSAPTRSSAGCTRR